MALSPARGAKAAVEELRGLLSRVGRVEQDDPDSGMHGDRLSDRGHAVAERACEQWKRTPLLQRLAVRMAG